jgi:hypothetical protein
VSQAVANLVKDWWEKETTISPQMKDVVRRHIVTKLYEAHLAHYLQMSKVSVIIFKLLDLLNLT